MEHFSFEIRYYDGVALRTMNNVNVNVNKINYHLTLCIT